MQTADNPVFITSTQVHFVGIRLSLIWTALQYLVHLFHLYKTYLAWVTPILIRLQNCIAPAACNFQSFYFPLLFDPGKHLAQKQ